MTTSSNRATRDPATLARLWGLAGGLLSGLEPFAFLDPLGLPWILATVALAVHTAARVRGERLRARGGARIGAHLASVAAPVTGVCLGLTYTYVELRVPRRGLDGPLAHVRSTPEEAMRDALFLAIVWAIAVVIVAPMAGALFGMVLGPRTKKSSADANALGPTAASPTNDADEDRP